MAAMSRGRAKAPVLFVRRRIRRHSPTPTAHPEMRGAERRQTRRLARPPERLASRPGRGRGAPSPFAQRRSASRRSTCGSRPGFRRDTGAGSALPGTRPSRPVPVQRAPRRGVVMPPGRFPGPPGTGVTKPRRRRRAPSHLRPVSGRRPSMDGMGNRYTIMGLKSIENRKIFLGGVARPHPGPHPEEAALAAVSKDGRPHPSRRALSGAPQDEAGRGCQLSRRCLSVVMAGFMPGIHVLL